jgi:hypothetical protein
MWVFLKGDLPREKGQCKIYIHKVNNKNNDEKKSAASLRVGLLRRGLAQGALSMKIHIHKVSNKKKIERRGKVFIQSQCGST